MSNLAGDLGVSDFVASLLRKQGPCHIPCEQRSLMTSLSYREMNWLTEIIELNDKHLVLKIEHIDWLNYFGRKEILLQHLRIA